MGAKSNSNKINNYYNISWGKITKKCEPDHPMAVTEVSESGKQYHMIQYDSYQGRLINITKRDGDYGVEFLLHMQDGSDFDVIQMKLYSSFAEKFMKLLPSVNLEMDIEIKPYDFISRDDGKRRKGVAVFQEGRKIQSKYTKEYVDKLKDGHKDKVPDWSKIKREGKEVWSNEQTIDFLWDMIQRDIIPTLNTIGFVPEEMIDTPKKTAVNPNKEFDSTDPNDGLPF